MVEIVRQPSRLWHFHAHILFAGGEAALIDPGIFPNELAALAKTISARGTRATHVFLTHSHHDHIRGWDRFPGARVVAPKAVAEKSEMARTRILAAKEAIDRRYGANDPGFVYPEPEIVFEKELSLIVGGTALHLRMNPGHSDCSSVIVAPESRALFSGDYLVSPGMPYCRWRIDRFEEALDRLRNWVREFGIETVYPAHNEPLRGAAVIETAIAEEERYFLRLRESVQRHDTPGHSEEEIAKLVSQEMRPGKLWDQDRDNAKRMLREIREN